MVEVTAIIPTYNRRDRTQRAVKSVLQQSVAVNEVLVIDDGSTDGTASAIRETFGSAVRLIQVPTNLGVSNARSVGMMEARGDLICFLDSDDIWMPKKIESQLPDMQNQNVILSANDWAWEDKPEIGSFADLNLTEPTTILDDPLELLSRFEGHRICIPTWMVRRDVLIRAACIDARMRAANDNCCLYRLAFEGAFALNQYCGMLRSAVIDSHQIMLPQDMTYRRNSVPWMLNTFMETYLRASDRPKPVQRRLRKLVAYYLCSNAELHSIDGDVGLARRRALESLCMTPRPRDALAALGILVSPALMGQASQEKVYRWRSQMINSARVLVAIANHGNGNREYLDQVIAAYRAMPVTVTIVVLSNIPKDLGNDVEIRVGTPSKDPWSLPFSHRTLFRERIEEFDYFIYSEDDTLMTWPALKAFIESVDQLNDDEIAGFFRTETGPDQQVYYSSCHSFFRWDPGSVRERGGRLWARYTNEHAACFVATRDQIRRAIASGGFPIAPHEGRHDMLCTAATDIYASCGLERLMCLDDLEKFILPHLPNKYIGVLGLPVEEMDWQVSALRKIHAGELSDESLLEPESRLPFGVGSKHCNEKPDSKFYDLIGDEPGRLLIWGAGDGAFETSLAGRGNDVSVIALDAVLGECCRHRSLNVLEPDLNKVLASGVRFDRIILRDVLHLGEKPDALIAGLCELLNPAGKIIARVPNLRGSYFVKRRFKDARFRLRWEKETIGAFPFTPKQLRQLFDRSQFTDVSHLIEVPENRKSLNKITLGMAGVLLSPYLYVTASRR